MAVLGRYDRQIRIRIEGAIRVGVTPSEILEIFNHLMLYGGFFITRTAMRITHLSTAKGPRLLVVLLPSSFSKDEGSESQ